MEKEIVYHSFCMPYSYLHFLNSISEKGRCEFIDSLYPPTQYGYQDFHFNDLAIKSKIDSDCLNELIRRLSRMLYHYAVHFTRQNRYAEFSETYQTLLDAVRDAVRVFDPNRGRFENLMRKVLYNSLVYKDKANGLSFYRKRKYFQRQLNKAKMNNFFADSEPEVDDVPERIKTEVDFEGYKDLLSPRERMILEMYLNGFTMREIQKKVHYSLSTIQEMILQMTKEIRECQKRKMI